MLYCSNIFSIYRAVVSPSIVGLVARITSLISPSLILVNKDGKLMSLIPMPLVGDNEPFKMWYNP